MHTPKSWRCSSSRKHARASRKVSGEPCKSRNPASPPPPSRLHRTPELAKAPSGKPDGAVNEWPMVRARRIVKSGRLPFASSPIHHALVSLRSTPARLVPGLAAPAVAAPPSDSPAAQIAPPPPPTKTPPTNHGQGQKAYGLRKELQAKPKPQ